MGPSGCITFLLKIAKQAYNIRNYCRKGDFNRYNNQKLEQTLNAILYLQNIIYKISTPINKDMSKLFNKDVKNSLN